MHKDLTYAINGALFKVHGALGSIWREEAYEKAVEIELNAQHLKTERQKKFQVFYFDKRVGNYRVDLLVEDKVIVELKVAPRISPLHQAQLISYLKGFDKPLGILANFGAPSLEHRTFPNKHHMKTPLRDSFDFDKVRTEGKEEIRELLIIANRILITLGTGYFHQVYKRAFHHELKSADIGFQTVKEVSAKYRDETVDSRNVSFFVIGDLLMSVVAVQELDNTILYRFRNYIDYLRLKKGLIFNFNALRLDFRYFPYKD